MVIIAAVVLGVAIVVGCYLIAEGLSEAAAILACELSTPVEFVEVAHTRKPASAKPAKRAKA